MSEKALSMKEYIDEAEAALLHTYNRYQVVLDKGDGVYLYDMEGKKYLDFCAGIAPLPKPRLANFLGKHFPLAAVDFPQSNLPLSL